MGPAVYKIGDYSVEAHGGQKDPQQAQTADHTRRHPLNIHGLFEVATIRASLNPDNQRGLVHSPNLPLDRRNPQARVASGFDNQFSPIGSLGNGETHVGLRRLLNVIDFDILNHSNDLVVLLFDPQAMPHRVLVWPETTGHSLADQDHFGSVGAVAGGKLAAVENPRPDRRKVIRADRIELDCDRLLSFGQLDARYGNPKVGSATVAAQRNSHRGG